VVEEEVLFVLRHADGPDSLEVIQILFILCRKSSKIKVLKRKLESFINSNCM
jgi:hypothetical protein